MTEPTTESRANAALGVHQPEPFALERELADLVRRQRTKTVVGAHTQPIERRSAQPEIVSGGQRE
ncbi:hypothetical protein [Flexivirga sp.]|uniref:hypothetical protein n=1 Tax=Flexivirga sp. TaxID=1962927 RepID=UPI003F7E8E12